MVLTRKATKATNLTTSKRPLRLQLLTTNFTCKVNKISKDKFILQLVNPYTSTNSTPLVYNTNPCRAWQHILWQCLKKLNTDIFSPSAGWGTARNDDNQCTGIFVTRVLIRLVCGVVSLHWKWILYRSFLKMRIIVILYFTQPYLWNGSS